MKIRLAILDKDKNYLNRISSTLSIKYADKFQIYSFSGMPNALDCLANEKIDVFLASEEFEINTDQFNNKCGFAYLVEAKDVDSVNGHPTICKYQKADLIYKQILGIYSESSGGYSSIRLSDEDTKTILFTSPCGGVGTSSVAAACAMFFAKQGKRVLYLNLEKFGSSDGFFSAEGNSDMSDVIFALKSKKSNLALKLESCVKKSANGVSFYSESKLALDMMELNNEEVIQLITTLQLSGSYDYLIVDIDFGLDKKSLSVIEKVHSIVWVCDGSETAVRKVERAYQALEMLEKDMEESITKKLGIIYNRFSSKTGMMIDDGMIRKIGGSQRFEHATTAQVIDALASKSFYENII